MTKITQTMFYDQYGTKKFALLNAGQTVEIDEVLEFDEYHFEDVYLCRVVNPSDESKNFGVREGMLVKVHEEYLDMQS